MKRKMFDCRDLPGDCTLAITGEEDEVVDGAGASRRPGPRPGGHHELREQIRAALKEAPPGA